MPSKPFPTPRFQVGIDLGTTNTVVAYSELTPSPVIELFPIEQLVGPGQTAARPSLPSTRYHPAADELPESDVSLPWERGAGGTQTVLGEYARVLGSKSPARQVNSAKSWLCHRNVDRLAPILPWNAPEGIPRVSPVEASASYLDHARQAWNQRYPDDPLEHQDIVLTVPASFETLARQRTEEAARRAGLTRIRLLEEPQSACYHWLWQHRRTIAEELAGCRTLLVIDIGGGTTDFSLVQIRHEGAGIHELNRIAVGDHLMLGGDNIDLALAHLAEGRLQGEAASLSAGQFAELLSQCRTAKEALLRADASASHPVTLLGSGHRLIGASRTVQLSAKEVAELVLDGFFPNITPEDLPARKRSAVVEFGLPYAADPAITKHIAAFLKQHRETIAGSGGGNPIPDAVLLNGGLFLSSLLAARVLDILARWRGHPLKQLRNDHPEFAVAFGAVAYGLAQRGLLGEKIRSSAARSYFLLLEPNADDAKGVCLLPKGSEAESEQVLADHVFALSLGRPVSFRLVSTNDETAYRLGQVVAVDPERFSPLPPLTLALQATGDCEATVRLAATITELGDLKVQCIEQAEPARHWELLFQLETDSVAPLPSSGSQPLVDEAAVLIGMVFGKKSKTVDPKRVKSLRTDLEKRFGKRADWPLPVLRGQFDALMQGAGFRRRSADHEKLWLNLAGYCLRPGHGAPLDEWRIDQLWPIYAQGIQHVGDAQVWSEWWTLWRRAAAGLDAEAQQRLFADLAPYIAPKAAKRGKTGELARKRGYEDMLRLAGSLERLPAATKTELGDWLLQRLAKPGEPEVSWWSLGRVGTRMPLYGSAHEVVAAATAERWLQDLLPLDWKKTAAAGFGAALIARMSGDRARDIEDSLRKAVIGKLQDSKCPRSWLDMVNRVAELTETDVRQAYGEALPAGLRLLPPQSRQA
ncbi:MAG: molecular chaperone DnaK [Methylococcaceae bacterium]|nr:molecular chaperone DnaK [Methylococcaceae bacterium]